MRIRSIAKAWLSLSLVCLGVTRLPGQEGQPPTRSSPLHVLTRVSEVRALTAKEAKLGYPVRLRGVISYYGHAAGWELFVQDSTGGIYVQPPEKELGLAAGDLVEVMGTTAPGFATEIVNPTIRVLGQATLPTPQRPRYEQLALGHADSEWVETEGVVHSVEPTVDPNTPMLTVAVGSGRIKIVVGHLTEAKAEGLIDAKIRVRGAAGGIFNQKDQFVGVLMHVPSRDYLEVKEQGRALGASPLLDSLNELARLSLRTTSGHRVKVRGVVTLQKAFDSLFITDASDSVRVETDQRTIVAPGDTVEVLGFPRLGSEGNNIEDASFRKVGSGPPPPPTDVSAATALGGLYDDALVRVGGRVFDLATERNPPALIIGSDQVAFEARILGSDAKEALARVERGSHVRVTGICQVQTDENGTPRAFRLLARSAADILIVEGASWWDLDRARLALGLMGALMLLAAGWALTLRRQVRAKTGEIREWLRREATLAERYRDLFENATDIVYTRDLEGNFTSWNKAAEQITGYTQVEALHLNLNQVVAPEYRHLLQRELCSTSDRPLENLELDLITKHAARVTVEVRSRLLYDKGQVVGVQGIARDVTERNRVAQQVRLQAAALAAAGSGIVITDPQGTMQWANPAFTAMSGYALEEVEGKNPRIFRSGKQAPEFYRELWETIRSGRIWWGEIINRRKDGSLYTEELTITPVRNPGSEITHFVAVKQDISLRKQLERALQESERRYRTLFENAPVGIYRTTADGCILAANPAFVRMTGYPSFEELARENLNSGGFGPAYVRREFLDLVEQGDVRGMEAEWRRRDGSRFFFRENARAIRDERGRVIYYEGTFEDITDRRRAEEALQESEERFRTLVENATVGIYRTTPEGRILMANPTLVTMLGYESVEALAARNLEEEGFEPDYPRSAFRERMERDGEVKGLESAWTKRDGSLMFVRESARAIRGEPGRVLYYDGIVEDITERKQVEVALQKAKEAAEDANRAKTEFLANMSHELRTPMNAIIGMTELALGTDLNPEQRLWLGVVESSANSLLTLIDQVLDFSEMEAGRIELASVPFILGDLLDEVVRPLSLRAHRQGLEMVCRVSPRIPPRLLGDPLRLKQIVASLVGNALKFTERGEVEVRVQLESSEQAAVGLHFTVTDTGVGIPADKLEMIFEAFTQVDGSMARRFAGAGLGLAASAELVRLMGGRIWAESQMGKGSAFHFAIRLKCAAGATPRCTETVSDRAAVERSSEMLNLDGKGQSFALRQPGEQSCSTTLRGIPVLVADGSASNRAWMEEILRHHGMVPTLVEDDEGALLAIRARQASGAPFRFILLAPKHVGKDEHWLANKAREVPGFSAAFLALLPAGQTWGDTGGLRELGFVDSLSKPVREPDLINALIRALEKTHPVENKPSPLCGSAKELGRVLRVLLVEDDEVSRRLAKRLLEKRGHQVVAALDKTDALGSVEQANAEPFDLVLMDADTGNVNGRDIARALRERNNFRERYFPIIGVTAQEASEENDNRNGTMDACLHHPVHADELFDVIGRLLANSPPTGQASSPPPKQPARAPHAPTFDEATFLTRLEGDPVLVGEVVEIFLAEYPKLLQGVCQAAAGGDPTALERAAHSLKGSVGDMAAPEAFEAARTVERIAREGTLEEAGDAISELQGAISRLVPELHKLRPSGD